MFSGKEIASVFLVGIYTGVGMAYADAFGRVLLLALSATMVAVCVHGNLRERKRNAAKWETDNQAR